MKGNKYVFFAVSSLVGFLLLWWGVVEVFNIKEFFLPGPFHVAQSLYFLFERGKFSQDIGVSIFRITTGFVVAVILAVPLGVVMGRSKFYEALFEPIIDFIRYTPVPAFIPLFILWFGIGEIEKIVVIASTVFFQLVLMVAQRVEEIPVSLIHSAKTLGVDGISLIQHVVFPYIQPRIFHDMRVSLGWAWSGLIMAELVGSTTGMGYVIIQSQRLLQTPHVMAGIVIVGALGLLTDYLCKYSHKKLFPWYVAYYD